ncbi:hypothetical protein BaRGS_00000966 [Batillaria attramentaria]|uniref:P-type domain-containing protein n=1 Tax=Batillaria attramentaria TaxID=370345 RepID=A0ABD0M995_9CAEN
MARLKHKEKDPFLHVDKRLRYRDASFLLKRMEGMQRFNFVLGVVAGLAACLVVIVSLYVFAPYFFVTTTRHYAQPTATFQDLQGQPEAPPSERDPPEIGDASFVRWSESLYHKLLLSRRRPDNEERSSASCTAVESDRFDCWPEYNGATQELCQARGCCWNGSPSVNGVPYCFYPDNYVSYTVSDVSYLSSKSGMTATLVRKTASPFPNDVVQLQVDVTFETESRLRFKIFDPKNQRYEVPLNLTKTGTPVANPDYNVTLQSNPFGILVTRKSNGAVLFDSRNMAPLVFADQFIQIGTRLSTPNIYGFGEHRHSLRFGSDWSQLVLWTRDQPPSGGGNLYGSHPFYLNLESDEKAHGVFLLNSNAIEVALQPYAQGEGALTYHALGGVLDFYIFTGPSPVSVIEQYVSLIGKPAMPPFWSLGFHLCKYGYWNSSELRKDVQWNDIDYMNKFKDWTYDSDLRYKGLREIVDDLHSNDQRYVVIIDPGISSTQTPGTYPPFDQGKQMDIFIKNASGEILVGKVWPGSTAFPDFFHPKSDEYWFNQMQSYHSQIPFDGLWIDMNEPSNFVDGSVNGCTKGPLDNPPFTPPSINGGKLISRTVCPSAQQAISSHYNLHNMYGWSETRATSNFPSTGYYGSHWLGDNRSEWPDLYYSIPGILNLNMFGVPMVGADICGFLEDTNRELCIRWMQLGAFYPFMRNHNMGKPQDPAVFDSTAVSYMRAVLEARYSLLAYMYTRFYVSHTTGSPVVRPLFMLFQGTEAIDRQFMWGNELLVSPVLDQGAISVNAYIPPGRWYDVFNRTVQINMESPGKNVSLEAPLGKINVHLRGGSIIPLLPPAVTTNALRKQPFGLVVASDENMTASGQLYWDDGESLDSVEAKKYTLVEFKMVGSSVKSNVIMGNYPAKLNAFEILAITSKPSAATLNGQSTPFQYDPVGQILTVDADVDLTQPFTLTWS